MGPPLSHRSKHSRAAPKMFRGRTKTPKTQDMETAHTATKRPLSAKPSNAKAPRTSSKQGRATTTWVDIPSPIQRLSPPPGAPPHGTVHTLPSEERPAGDPGSQGPTGTGRPTHPQIISSRSRSAPAREPTYPPLRRGPIIIPAKGTGYAHPPYPPLQSLPLPNATHRHHPSPHHEAPHISTVEGASAPSWSPHVAMAPRTSSQPPPALPTGEPPSGSKFPPWTGSLTQDPHRTHPTHISHRTPPIVRTHWKTLPPRGR